MEGRNVRWNRRALLRLQQLSDWYEQNVGVKARDNFRRDTLKAIELLRYQPGMGKLDHIASTPIQKRYHYCSHPLIMIEYRFTDTDITIIAIRSTRMSR